MIKNLKDFLPKIHASVYISESADVIGQCVLKENASIWFNAVLRADIAKIVIGKESNIQDGCILHVDYGKPVIVGERVTVGHNAVLHACTIEDEVLIGMGAIILDGAIVKKGALVAAGAVVTPNTIIPENTMYVGNPAKFKKNLSDTDKMSIINNAMEYVKLSKSI